MTNTMERIINKEIEKQERSDDLHLRLLSDSYYTNMAPIKTQLVEALYKHFSKDSIELWNVVGDILDNYLVVPKTNIESFVKFKQKHNKLIGTMCQEIVWDIPMISETGLTKDEHNDLVESLKHTVIQVFMESLERLDE